MLCIVLCHLQQAYDNKWAWVFNVGVQIFLALSGWLYGMKNIGDWRIWCKDKFIKLYIPYIIYVLIAFFVYRLFSIESFTFKNLVIYFCDLQWFLGNVEGLSHLWFMTAIAVCYLLTPILQYVRNKGWASISLSLLVIYGILNYYVFDISLDLFTCLFIYLFSYLFVSVKPTVKKIYIIGIICLFIYILSTLKWGILLDYSNGINKIFHVLFALVCVIIPIAFFGRFKKMNVPSFVRLSDRYSYYIYITHHLFILGPFSLAYLTSSTMLNLVLIILLTMFSAAFLMYLSKNVNNLILYRE